MKHGAPERWKTEGPGRMPTDSQLVATSIEEMLVSLAGGVREAQDALNDLPPFDSFGRPSPTYFIPHVDFDLEIEVKTDSNNRGRPIMLMATKMGGSSSTESTTKGKISGRLIAIPPGEGLPTPQLNVSVLGSQGRRFDLLVSARNSAGELLVGQSIELNIDIEASKLISRGADPALPTARLENAMLVTDDRGEAKTSLTLSAGGGQGKMLMVVAQLGATTAKALIDSAGAA